jgi:hypothetical protein
MINSRVSADRYLAELSIKNITMSPPNNRLHTDAALRASANGCSELALFPSQQWFQADVRAARVKRDVGQQKESDVRLSSPLLPTFYRQLCQKR